MGTHSHCKYEVQVTKMQQLPKKISLEEIYNNILSNSVDYLK